MNTPPLRATEDLLKNRTSTPGARYFLTLCTKDRTKILATPATLAAIDAERLRMEGEACLQTLELVVMPDHIHWLIKLGARLTLSQAVARFKAKTRRHLMEMGGEWQKNYYDHRLEPEEEAEPYARYMFLNPWRARLVAWDTPWPYRVPAGVIHWHFLEALTSAGTPPVAWQTEKMSRPDTLIQAHGRDEAKTDEEASRNARHLD